MKKKIETEKSHVKIATHFEYVLPTRKGDQETVIDHFHIAPLPHLVQQVVELWRRRQAWHRAEKSLSLQIQSFCRRACNGDKAEGRALYEVLCKKEKELHGKKKVSVASQYDALLPIVMLSTAPLLDGRKPIEEKREEIEKQLHKLAESLPGYSFCVNTKGLSGFTVFSLVGECPGINSMSFLDFDTPARVFKRLGLAVMDDGTRQRKIAGKGDEAIKHGYNPARRSVVWTIGDSIIKGDGPYRKMYDDFKVVEQKAAEAKGLTILPAAQISDKRKSTGKYISEGHIHRRAKRKMEKAMVRDIWAAFRADAREQNLDKAA